MGRLLALVYGGVAYAVFLASFLWAIAWVGNVPLGRLPTMDSGPAASIGPALLVNTLLLGLFALQHSVMARPAFKRMLTRVISPAIERSTYVLLSSLVLLLLLYFWQPLSREVWHANGPLAMLLWAVQALGWLILLLSTFMISHFDLFGLRQVFAYWKGEPVSGPPFLIRGFYRLVRHPIMFGFVVAFWVTPVMSVGHLFFALMTTVYILIALQFEEHDLAAALGEDYRRYQKQVPMLIPWRW